MKPWRPTYPAIHARSYADIEKTARLTRANLIGSASEVAAIPGRHVFENELKGKQVCSSTRRLSLDYSCSSLAAGVEGETRHDTTRDRECILICLSVGTYLRLEADEPDARFSLYHEIGHGVMHVDELIKLAQIPHHHFTALMQAVIPTHLPIKDTEWQADAFAAAMLMPARGLARLEQQHKILLPNMLAKLYRVSLPVAEERLRVFQKYKKGLLR